MKLNHTLLFILMILILLAPGIVMAKGTDRPATWTVKQPTTLGRPINRTGKTRTHIIKTAIVQELLTPDPNKDCTWAGLTRYKKTRVWFETERRNFYWFKHGDVFVEYPGSSQCGIYKRRQAKK